MSVTKLNYDEQTEWYKSFTGCYNLYRLFFLFLKLHHSYIQGERINKYLTWASYMAQ